MGTKKRKTKQDPELKLQPVPKSADREVTREEMNAVLLACRLIQALEPAVPLSEKLNNPDYRRDLRSGLEKMLAICEDRTNFNTPENHILFLRGRISEAVGWLRIGLTHGMWGSVEDAYGAFNGRSPPVGHWRKAGFVGAPYDRPYATFEADPPPIKPPPGTSAQACGRCSACVAFRNGHGPGSVPCLNPKFVKHHINLDAPRRDQ